ncbi:hypothetical protein P3L10_013680 [Capsicum annuum]|uniref:uncharacterized protein LOC107869733 n=1 Tax=Capsicum annuum TaxID=4072 RepID=UPI0007BECFEA|nr:uncharacterized protein LOC107869733 [Capsicum annuum]
MKQQYMKKFIAFIDEANDPFIDGLKIHLDGVTVISSSKDGEDGHNDQNLDRNSVSRHVTHGARTSKLRTTEKTSIIKNLEERVFMLEEAIKDIVDFVKQERLRRAEKEKHKKKEENEGTKLTFISEGFLR